MFEHEAHGGSQCRRREGCAGSRSERGFSLPELLVVLAIIGAFVVMAIPLVNEHVRIAELRSAADGLAVHLRAARMLAVTTHQNVVVTISADPTNEYWYLDSNGQTRLIKMPGRVKIKTGSAPSITFHTDGSSGASSTVTTESAVSTATERWILNVNTVGMVSISHVRV